MKPQKFFGGKSVLIFLVSYVLLDAENMEKDLEEKKLKVI